MIRICACLLLLAAVGGCAESSAKQDATQAKPEAQSAAAVRVEVARVQASDTRLEMKLPGEVRGWKDSQLAAALGGYIESVNVEAGENVKRAQVLARVDSATHLARLAQAKVQLDEAKREHERAQALGGAIPDAERDAAKSRLDGAKAAVQGAQVAANRTLISAPFAGTIASVDVEQGEAVAPGAPLMRLVQLDPVKVTVSVPGRDVVTLSEGSPAWVRPDALGTTIQGEISRIQPAADLKTRSFIVEVRVSNPEHKLLPGMIASVTLKGSARAAISKAPKRTGTDEDTASAASTPRIVIPQDFLVTGLEKVGVFVVKDDTAHWKPVDLGPVVRDQVVIAGGLEVGDRLVITGHRDLATGDPLIVAREGTCCTDGRVVFTPERK